MNDNQVILKFLGVRGSYNLSNPDVNRYGGNTSCVQVSTSKDVFYVDAGSGITKVDEPDDTRQMHLLLTHYHWDHILGLPFFSNLYTHSKPLIIRGMKPEYYSLEEVMQLIFNPPFCPINWKTVSGKIEMIEVPKTGAFNVNDMRIKHIPIMHPGGALGYRFEFKGNVICLLTDIELSSAFETYEKDMAQIVNFVKDADILIMDAAMTDDEYYGIEGSNKIGWGHSTINECLKLVKRASVKSTYITHYLPYRSDTVNDKIYSKILKENPNVHFAVEGESITLEAKNI